MKKIILSILLLNISCISKAQIFDLNNNPNYADVTNGYYKDIDNFQNQFVGTWVYQNGSTRLDLRFRKIEMMLRRPGSRQYYEDVLVGEYKYIENGVEKVNSLPNLNIDHPTLFDYNLYSVTKISLSGYPKCDECPEGTERLYMKFDEPANDDFGLDAIFVIRRVVENSVEKLKVQFVHMNAAINVNKADFDMPSTFREFSLPYGNYTLTKQ